MTLKHLEVAIHAFSVLLLVQCCDIRHDFATVVRYIIKHLFYIVSIKQPDLYHFETIKMTSQA